MLSPSAIIKGTASAFCVRSSRMSYVPACVILPLLLRLAQRNHFGHWSIIRLMLARVV